MRHVAGGGGATRRGVFCAIVLIALLTLLHATRTPGVGHLPGPDVDRCAVDSPRQVVLSFADDVIPGEHVPQADAPSRDSGGGRHEPAVGSACTATSRQRHHTTAASVPAVVETLGFRLAGAAEAGDASACTSPNTPAGAPALTVVLRC